MRRTIALLNILLAVALIYSPVAAAAQQSASSGDWGSVKAMPQGAELSIKLKDGQTVRGKLTSVTDTALSITGKNNRTETLDRNNISEVYQLRRKAEKGKYALIGAGVGAAIGGGIGVAKESSESDDSEILTVVGVLLGAGIGAVGGLLFGQGKRKRILIYQAR
jgi:small nuclear ribonucleoprotein (snRNP)-like protein